MPINGIEDGASIIDMEEKNIPCRLASLSGLEGCQTTLGLNLKIVLCLGHPPQI